MPDNVEAESTTGLDQPILFDPTHVLDDLDHFYDQALTMDNAAFVILNKGKELVAKMRVEGLLLCKLLHRLKSDWNKLGIQENFENAVFGVIGLNVVTIDRYISVWDMFDKGRVPKEMEPYIMSLQLRSQIPIAKALEQGHTINEDEWKRLMNAPDNATIRDEVRRIKGQEMRKSGVMFMLKINGDLMAMDSNKKEHFVGWLDVKTALSDPVVRRCIERIVDNSYIIREKF